MCVIMEACAKCFATKQCVFSGHMFYVWESGNVLRNVSAVSCSCRPNLLISDWMLGMDKEIYMI